VGDRVLSVLGKKRALDVLDYLNGEPDGARFIDVQKNAANGVPSSATELLEGLRGCGAVTKDVSRDLPRYRITAEGEVARACLHRALDALNARAGRRLAGPRISRGRASRKVAGSGSRR
jgi:DNA-binding IclR family transcriptional regulator